jgi:hypothetical protein
VVAELLGEELEGLGLAGTGGPGHQAVPVEHPERDPESDVGLRLGVEHQPAQLEGRTLERLARSDGYSDRVGGAACLHARSLVMAVFGYEGGVEHPGYTPIVVRARERSAEVCA